ncbi:MAG TPA: hypothetical protein DCF33_13185 [Saprospirales bacterium]|nr:hypothetical protein [Saprospirales bacterium]
MFHHAPAICFQYAFKNRETATKAEEVLWNALKGKKLGGYKFRRQHPASRYILDFYCHAVKMAIEVDGGYHFNEEQQRYDNQRSADLLDLGIKVIRFTNEHVLNDLEAVLNAILHAVEAQTAQPPTQ